MTKVSARFSELFRRARAELRRRIAKRGGEAVAIVPAEDFERSADRTRQPASLVAFFRSAPTGGKTLDVRQKRDATRTIKW